MCQGVHFRCLILTTRLYKHCQVGPEKIQHSEVFVSITANTNKIRRTETPKCLPWDLPRWQFWRNRLFCLRVLNWPKPLKIPIMSGHIQMILILSDCLCLATTTCFSALMSVGRSQSIIRMTQLKANKIIVRRQETGAEEASTEVTRPDRVTGRWCPLIGRGQ